MALQNESLLLNKTFLLDDMVEMETTTRPMEAYEICRCIMVALLLLGSLLLTVVILAKRELRENCTNWLVLSVVVPVCILDVCVSVIMIQIFFRLDNWTAGLVACQCFYLVVYLVYLALPYTLLALFIDRCMYVWDPVRRQRPLVAVLLINVSWLVSVVLTVSVVFGALRPAVYSGYGDHSICAVGMRNYWAMQAFGYGVPAFIHLVVMVTVLCRYCLVACRLADKTTINDARHAMTVVIVLSVLYILLTLPEQVPRDRHDAMLYWQVASFLRVSYITMQPFLMMVLLPDVRATIGKLLCGPKTSEEGEGTRLVKPM